jgi:hypothetical protein
MAWLIVKARHLGKKIGATFFRQRFFATMKA